MRSKKKIEKLSSYEADLMERLKDQDYAKEYLLAAIEENDEELLLATIGQVAKAHSISKVANKAKIDRRTIYRLFEKGANPSFINVWRILQILGLQITIDEFSAKKVHGRKVAQAR